MKRLLIDYGMKSNFEILHFFDYLTDYIPERQIITPKTDSIAFAANIEHTEFLKYIDKISNISVNLYGPTPKDEYINKHNTKYFGSYDSEGIVKKLVCFGEETL